MSRRPNGGGGGGSYNNGYSDQGGYGGLGPAEDDYSRRPSAEQRRPSADSRRPPRNGGYGGFGEREEAPAVQRPVSLERSAARRRSGERQGEVMHHSGPGSQKMEEILQTIKQNFDFMTNEQCVPVEVALKLMDASSLGLANQYDMFRETHSNLQRALKVIVNGMSSSRICLLP
jgi:exocyst complex component 4